jgi:hypothetical protein
MEDPYLSRNEEYNFCILYATSAEYNLHMDSKLGSPRNFALLPLFHSVIHSIQLVIKCVAQGT